MRRKDREVKDLNTIKEIISKCEVVRLAMCEDNIPYIVPLNYGYEFDHLEFLVDTLGGIGAGGALDFLKQFYEAANEIYKQNPLAFDLLILNFPRIKKLFTKVFDIIQNNLKYYDSFEQGIKFQKQYTLDSFTKALQLEEIRRLNNRMTYFQMVNAFLIVFGYKYDYKHKKWIKS